MEATKLTSDAVSMLPWPSKTPSISYNTTNREVTGVGYDGVDRS